MGVVAGVFAAAGQTCVAGSRVLVHREASTTRCWSGSSARAATIAIGDPLDDATELGPLAIADQLEKVESYVALGRSEGGKVVSGGPGRTPASAGTSTQPTVFVGADNNMRICREEIFGPVATVMPFDSEEEARPVANDIDYGLAAGRVDPGPRTARTGWPRRLEAGTVWVNTYRSMSPMSPRSGFKTSGMGIEHGTEVVREYTRLKSVWINTSEEPAGDPFILRS